ncbi:helix-hairpin-helix domain-containing protein [Reichenbachiella versicolor]|uniref:helix-hairpin-helix domain-containing protein n=1 Tax=Reichenbachiella versicolor TaxID=1821036 RepID=UPI000D6E7B22|nr:helix-hairpin-helix domain-containing protein [Reichenbachiella versicolor]
MKKPFLIIFLLTPFISIGQIRPEIDLQKFIENLFQFPEEDIVYDDLYESLYQIYINPINLNNTNYSELTSLYMLTPIQINNLISFIEKNHPLLSIYELQTVDGFSEQDIRNILPFIEVRSPGDYQTKGNLMKRISIEENKYFIFRSETVFEQQQGFEKTDSTGFLGYRNKLYGRFRASHSKDFSFGFTFENDPGEQIAWNAHQRQYGMDYYSAHLLLEEKERFKKILIGDYQMQFGQGLVVGSGFNPGKGAETITTIQRSNSGIRPYTSVLESGFFRGTAFTYQLHPNWSISPFYTRLRQDASLKMAKGIGNHSKYISSIQNTGFHRTLNEIKNKKQIIEQTYGLNITYQNTKNRNFEAGLTFLKNRYSLNLIKTPNNYNQHEFQGNQNYNIGVFTNYNFQNFLFFGEWAISRSSGSAYLIGLLSSLTNNLSFSLSARKYDPNYHSFYGNSFGEGSRTINEQGFYWGIKYRPSKKLWFSAYYDKFKFPWNKHQVEAPSDGNEYLLRFNYSPSKKAKTYLQFREERKEKTIGSSSNLKTLAEGIKRNYLGNIELKTSDLFSLKSRVQYSTYTINNKTSQGAVMTQDINLSFKRIKMSARFAIFDTEDYENRQYVYEKDVLYAFSIPAYSGQGTRNYLLVQYQMNRKLTAWCKLGRYNYENQNIIGSGNNKILDNKKTELKIQLRFKM